VLDIRMVVLAAGWNDLGAWEAVWQVARRTPPATPGRRRHRQDSRNTLVHATSRLVSVVGLDDVVVVETADAVLVAAASAARTSRRSSTQLGAEQRGEHALHRKVHRPWGWYDSIDRARATRSSASWSSPAPA
jgi:mannose-1-phosphate guanylyltransferase / mannose-6-phosphate isomerase